MQNYEPDVTQLLGLYQQLEDDIVADMVRRMLRTSISTTAARTTTSTAQKISPFQLKFTDLKLMSTSQSFT